MRPAAPDGVAMVNGAVSSSAAAWRLQQQRNTHTCATSAANSGSGAAAVHAVNLPCDPRCFAVSIYTRYTMITYMAALAGALAECRLACWTQAQYGLGSNRSRDAVG